MEMAGRLDEDTEVAEKCKGEADCPIEGVLRGEANYPDGDAWRVSDCWQADVTFAKPIGKSETSRGRWKVVANASTRLGANLYLDALQD